MSVLRVVIVDDEQHNLNLLSRALSRIEDIQVVGSFLSPQQALVEIQRLAPQLVFTDIEMPAMNGLELAEQLAEMPIRVVFVTAFSKYAVDAFRVNALDYLLKPTQLDEVRRVVDKARAALSLESAQQKKSEGQPPKITAFGPLQVLDERERPVRFTTEKAQELFCFLLLSRGSVIKRSEVCRQLFPSLPSDRGMTNLYSVVYRLKKTLLSAGGGLAISSAGGGYHLTTGRSWCDLDEFANGVHKSSQSISVGWLSQLLSCWRLVTGELLEGAEYPWLEPYRQQMRQRYLEMSCLLCDYYGADSEEGQQVLAGAIQRYPDEKANLLRQTGGRL